MMAHTATIPEAELRGTAEKSLALIAANYMNFSIRLGYHFSQVEAWVGDELNDNYVRFFFKGGGAVRDRRLRRVRLIGEILAKMDFRVRIADDVVRAVAAKYRRPELERTLEAMGKLTAYTKQLDMAMFNDSVTDWYRDEFVREHLGKGGRHDDEAAARRAPPTCSACSAIWRASGTTNCWSGDPETAPPRPGTVPRRTTTGGQEDLRRVLAVTEDARMAFVAARVEGLCYEKPRCRDGQCTLDPGRGHDRLCQADGLQENRHGHLHRPAGRVRRLATILPHRVSIRQGLLQGRQYRQNGTGAAGERQGPSRHLRTGLQPDRPGRDLQPRGTDMNIIVGLCVGHDMLFNKHSQAPVTTLIVKDRVTGHNPIAVLYGQNFYYKRLQKEPLVVPGE